MFEQVLDGDISFPVVVEVEEDQADPRGGVHLLLVPGLHVGQVDAHGLSEQSQVELHVHCDWRRVEAVLGASGSVGLLEERCVVGGNAQHASREDAVVDGILDCVFHVGPVVGCQDDLRQQQECEYNSHNQ